MSVLPSKLLTLTRRLAASVLLIWLAGIGCIIGCEMHVAAAPKATPITTTEAESCTMPQGHGCCKEVAGSDRRFAGLDKIYVGNHQDVTTDPCCQPTAVTSDPARKVSPMGTLFTVANNGIPLAPDFRASSSLLTNRLRIPDRGSTRLRCCVFLI